MDARDWDRRWEDKRLHARGEPSSAVIDALGNVAPGKALDLGCGSGRHAVWLAEHGWEVTAVDFSSEALRQARERATDHSVDVEWIEADLVAYRPRDAAFDLVLLGYIHVPARERRAILGAAAAALRPGGTFLLVGHDITNIGTGAPGPASPAVLYAPADIVAELPTLDVVRAERVRRDVELEDGAHVEAIDALVLARTRGEIPAQRSLPIQP